MPNDNPSLNRRWLQVDGLPPAFEHGLARKELDRATRVEMTPTNRVCFFEGEDILAAVDFSTIAKRRMMAGIANRERDQVSAEPKPAAPGDTVIRPIDLNDPLAKALIEGGPRFAAGDVVPPLELPDYVPPAADPRSEPNRAGDALEDAIKSATTIADLRERLEDAHQRVALYFAAGAGIGALIASAICAVLFH